MLIQFFCPSWGNTLPFADFCRRAKEAGYDGIETALPLDPTEKASQLAALRQHGLSLIGQFWQSAEADFAAHAQNFERYLRHLAAAKPVFINSQTGKDFFTFEQNRQLFALADRIATETGVKIVHETHRGKALFAAHITAGYLPKLPNARLTLDISHWCNVHESLLQNQAAAVELALQRTDHIHTRVGHPEGPQVNDPRAPEWASTVEAHLTWWDRVVALHRQRNSALLTMTTEFGPVTYLPALPYTQLPVADQWEINVHMLNLLKKRYS